MINSNEGFLIQNSSPSKRQNRCVIVVGVARGGTSAIASSLSSIGVYMGDSSSEPTYEDQRLISCIPSKVDSLLKPNAWRQFLKVADEYSEHHDHWGLKYPNIHKYLPKIHSLLDSPKYIFVYRDIFAISNRRSDIYSQSHTDSQKNCLRIYKHITSFIDKYNPHCLHVSYEKLLLNKGSYIDILSGFCGVTLSDSIRENALRSIEVSPKNYQQWSGHQKQAKRFGNTSYKGVVQAVTNEKIVGWACDTQSNDPVSVDILINGQSVGTCIADQKRPKIFRKFATLTDLLGFQYTFDTPLLSAAVVKVVITGTEIELINSGKKVEEY